ncbi:hypothetical protein ACFVS2_21445 [Brevibacillus sp. NPDC058079]|uniref:hypothetical protein n=1 Tax=Brevibacillus sp. NPDC058079 TaxID=3346330 RepID=UPI0036E44807
MITMTVKSEIMKMYGDMMRHELIEHSLSAMGNFAFFAERCLAQSGNQQVKQTINAFISSKKKVELFFLIANSIYEYAKKEGIGENLDFRMSRVIEKYERKTLNHFEILLDEYDYPDWFKRYIPFIEANHAQDIYDLLMQVVQSKPNFEQQMLEKGYATKTHIFVHRVCRNSMKWQYVLSLVDAYSDEDQETALKLLAFQPL